MRCLPVVFILFIMMSGCRSSEDWSQKGVVRSVEETPEVGYPPGLEPDQDHCRTSLVDAKDGTELTLVRSSNGMGDYEVPTGKYGLESGELLRIDCQSGEVLGIVRL